MLTVMSPEKVPHTHAVVSGIIITFQKVVTWFVINLCISPAFFTFSSSPHGGGLLRRSGRRHCQCEGCTGDQRWRPEEYCEGAHQHLGAPVWPLCPVLHWDLGEMLCSCQGGVTSTQCLVPNLSFRYPQLPKQGTQPSCPWFNSGCKLTQVHKTGCILYN